MIPSFSGKNVGSFNTSKTYCKYSLTDIEKPVIVTFSMLGKYVETKQLSCDQDVWGYDFFIKKGLNCVSFCCIDNPTWYRDPELIQLLEVSAINLSVFPERLGYGGSMGGFGVLSLGNLLKLDRVLVFNPITTLSKKVEHFETRFLNAQKKLDWNSKFSDGALYNGKGTVVYDPLFELDNQHVKRLNLNELKLPGVGHFIPVHLKKLLILDWLVDGFLNNTIDQVVFYEKARKRRDYNRYYEWLLSEQNIHLTPKRRIIIDKYWRDFLYSEDLAKIIKSNEINKLRDLAISLEKYDINMSFAIMTIVSGLRPEGKYIARKLSEYKLAIEAVDHVS